VFHKNSSRIVKTAISGRYTQWVTVSFVADVTAKQSAWEQSGKFEGDIMLTEEQLRNGVINPASRWPNKVVLYYIDPVFSKYCSTKLQSGIRDVAGNIILYEYRFSSSTHWRLRWQSMVESYPSLILKTIIQSYTHTHTHTSSQPCKYILDPTINTTSKCHIRILLNTTKSGGFYLNVGN